MASCPGLLLVTGPPSYRGTDSPVPPPRLQPSFQPNAISIWVSIKNPHNYGYCRKFVKPPVVY